MIKSCIGEDSADSDAMVSLFTVAPGAGSEAVTVAASATADGAGGAVMGVAGELELALVLALALALAASDAWELLLILSAAIAADAVVSVNAAMMTVYWQQMLIKELLCSVTVFSLAFPWLFFRDCGAFRVLSFVITST